MRGIRHVGKSGNRVDPAESHRVVIAQGVRAEAQ